MARIVAGLASKPYPGGRGKTGVGFTSVVCDYKDVFLEELLGLPLHRDVDLCIELHLDTLPISMMPHRMTLDEL